MPPLPPTPAASTEASLVGDLCTDGKSCICRTKAELAGLPPAGKKRYYVELGPAPHPLWLEIAGQRLYKSQERGQSCFVIDLPSGQHPVRFHASGTEGVSASFKISEQGYASAEDEWWYATFRFECGGPGLCDRPALDAERSRMTALGGKHDPCGSTLVKGVSWRTGKASDGIHPDSLFLQATLEIYEFKPPRPDSAECPQ